MNKYSILVFVCLTISAFAYRPHKPRHGYHSMNEHLRNENNNHKPSENNNETHEPSDYGYSVNIHHNRMPHRRHHDSPRNSHSYVSTYDSGAHERPSGNAMNQIYPINGHYMPHTIPTTSTSTSTTTRATTTTTRMTTTTTRPTTTTTPSTTTRPTTTTTPSTTTRPTTTTTTTYKPHYHKHYFYFRK